MSRGIFRLLKKDLFWHFFYDESFFDSLFLLVAQIPSRDSADDDVTIKTRASLDTNISTLRPQSLSLLSCHSQTTRICFSFFLAKLLHQRKKSFSSNSDKNTRESLFVEWFREKKSSVWILSPGRFCCSLITNTNLR
jgi:hypothetical protein